MKKSIWTLEKIVWIAKIVSWFDSEFKISNSKSNIPKQQGFKLNVNRCLICVIMSFLLNSGNTKTGWEVFKILT